MNKTHSETEVKPVSLVLIIGLPILVYCLANCLALAGFFAFNYYYIKWEESHDIEFDLDLWHAGSRDKIYSYDKFHIDAPRLKMSRDFIANQPWRGKTKNELRAWLGEPDYWSGNYVRYWVGLQRGPIKMDYAWLGFQFDDDGKAIKAELWQD
jgi:hypothetical protein